MSTTNVLVVVKYRLPLPHSEVRVCYTLTINPLHSPQYQSQSCRHLGGLLGGGLGGVSTSKMFMEATRTLLLPVATRSKLAASQERCNAERNRVLLLSKLNSTSQQAELQRTQLKQFYHSDDLQNGTGFTEECRNGWLCNGSLQSAEDFAVAANM